jgi:sugar (pentulose or hexulose) kinase
VAGDNKRAQSGYLVARMACWLDHRCHFTAARIRLPALRCLPAYFTAHTPALAAAFRTTPSLRWREQRHRAAFRRVVFVISSALSPLDTRFEHMA